MSYVSSTDFLQDCRTGRPIRIRIFNLGENLGMDFAYFCHYHSLKKAFPNVTLDLCRSNVDETNCIGFDQHHGRGVLPIDSLQMAVVRQRYPDGTDWVQRLHAGDMSIFPPGFTNISGSYGSG